MSELDLMLQINNLAARLQDLERNEKRAIACRVYNSGAFTHDDNGNWKAMTFDSESWDATGMHSTVTNTSRITANVGGWYYIWGGAVFTANSTGTRGLAVRKDGTTYITNLLPSSAPSASVACALNVSTIYYLAATNYLELMAFQSSGGNLDVLVTGAYSPAFAAIRLP